VRKGRHKESGKSFAIKCIQKKFIKLHLLEREIKIMKKLKHAHILPLIEVFENKEYIFLVLELVTGGELFDKIVERGNYSEKDASNIVRQILEAVAYLHSEGEHSSNTPTPQQVSFTGISRYQFPKIPLRFGSSKLLSLRTSSVPRIARRTSTSTSRTLACPGSSTTGSS
jgi:serine/threonine protein kinase